MSYSNPMHHADGAVAPLRPARPSLAHAALADDNTVVDVFTSPSECAAYCRMLGFMHLPHRPPALIAGERYRA